MDEKVLVTGSSGFIGSFIVEEALERGMQVWAGVRRGSSRAYLQDSRIHFLELDFSSKERLTPMSMSGDWNSLTAMSLIMWYMLPV